MLARTEFEYRKSTVSAALGILGKDEDGGDYAGTMGDDAMTSMNQFLQSYTPKENDPYIDLFKTCFNEATETHKGWEKNPDFAKQQKDATFERYQQGKPIWFSAGTIDHEIDIVIYGNFLGIADRATTLRMGTCCIYKFLPDVKVTPETIEGIFNSYNAKTLSKDDNSFLNLWKRLCVRIDVYNDKTISPQDKPNCTEANKKGAYQLLQVLQDFYKGQEDVFKPQTLEEVKKTFKTISSPELHQQRKSYYKHFSNARRDHAIQELLERVCNTTELEELRLLDLELLGRYCGVRMQEMESELKGELSSQKIKADLGRVEDIISTLLGEESTLSDTEKSYLDMKYVAGYEDSAADNGIDLDDEDNELEIPNIEEVPVLLKDMLESCKGDRFAFSEGSSESPSSDRSHSPRM